MDSMFTPLFMLSTNAVSENIGVKHLMNVKTIAERRENMLWFKVPPKVYFKYGCLPFALREINDRKRAFLVTDKPLFDLGYTEKVTSVLEGMGIDVEIFYEVKPDPDTDTIEAGLARMNSFKPDLIIALGGGSPMDAAKMMWLRYENPEAKFEDMAMRFMDIEKRIYTFRFQTLYHDLRAAYHFRFHPLSFKQFMLYWFVQ